MKELYTVVFIDGNNESDLLKTYDLQKAIKENKLHHSYGYDVEIRIYDNVGNYDLVEF